MFFLHTDYCCTYFSFFFLSIFFLKLSVFNGSIISFWCIFFVCVKMKYNPIKQCWEGNEHETYMEGFDSGSEEEDTGFLKKIYLEYLLKNIE